MADKRIYTVHGGYYPTGTAPKEHLSGYEVWRDFNMHKSPDFVKTPEFYLPDIKEIPASQYIPARRPDPTNKTGIETLNTGYDKETMGHLLDAYRTAVKQYGVPQLTPKELTAMALVEGRSNFGYNDFDYNDPQAVKIQQGLIKQGFDPYAAGFPAAIMNKQQLANRLNKPYFHVWNGDGPAAALYNKRVEGALDTVEHPKNSELYQYIQSKSDYVPPKVNPIREANVKEVPLQPISDEQIAKNSIEMPDGYRFGGRIKLI
jgi:hypothetical protein